MEIRLRLLPLMVLCAVLLTGLGASGASAIRGPDNGAAAYNPAPRNDSTRTGAPSATPNAAAPPATSVTATVTVTTTPAVTSGTTPATPSVPASVTATALATTAAVTAAPTVSETPTTISATAAIATDTIAPTVAPVTATAAAPASATAVAPSGVSATLPLTPETGAPLTATVATLNAAPAVTTTAADYGRLPLSFEPNVGQAGPDGAPVRFLAHGPGYSLFLTGTGATLTLRAPRARAPHDGPLAPQTDALSATDVLSATDALSATTAYSASVVRLSYAGANPTPQVVGDGRLPGVVNYFIGADPHGWHTGIPTYARVAYTDVYPGVDLVYYGHAGQLEYDWRVRPGTDPRAIALRVEGPRGVALDPNGNLDLQTDAGTVVQRAPLAYQDIDGRRRPVTTAYTLKGGVASLTVGSYDPTQPLTIDPVLAYSTHLGGSGDDHGYGIAVDASGSAYVTGQTRSNDFPTTPGVLQGSYKGSPKGGGDAFVTKLNPAGTAWVYSTYLGGSADDAGYGIAVDAAGAAYITGQTASNDFPTTPGVAQSSYKGNGDAFAAKLNVSGAALVYATYLGGDGADAGRGIALDPTGAAYVTGQTASTDFPTTPDALQNTSGGSGDAFMTTLTPSGAALAYSTYLGGSQTDDGYGVAVDPAGNAYLTGDTSSSNFPTTPGVAQGSAQGGADAFVAKIVGAASGVVPWHPHHSVRLSDGLSVSVDLADGHLDLSAADLSIPGRGPALALAHTWDSTLAQGTITTTAGQG